MFSRLLKHEWKANAGLLGILSLAIFGIGIVATVVLRILVNQEGLDLFGTDAFPLEVMATAAMGMFLFFSVIALSVYIIAVQVILLYRFYKNKYTDEGYLTFTLPVKTSEIFWSSFVNMLLWLLIAGAVVAVIVCMALLFGTAQEGLINTDIFGYLSEMAEIFSDLTWADLFEEGESVIYAVLMLLQLLVTPFYALFIPMCCITMGAVLAKKHKILASFGMYYAVNFVVGIITSVATIVPSLFMLGNGSEDVFLLASTGIEVFVTLALTLGAYFLTIHLMKHKLNLP